MFLEVCVVWILVSIGFTFTLFLFRLFFPQIVIVRSKANFIGGWSVGRTFLSAKKWREAHLRFELRPTYYKFTVEAQIEM